MLFLKVIYFLFKLGILLKKHFFQEYYRISFPVFMNYKQTFLLFLLKKTQYWFKFFLFAELLPKIISYRRHMVNYNSCYSTEPQKVTFNTKSTG